MIKVNRFKDLGYTTIFNSITGFFARIPDRDTLEPFWSPHGPELMDISITNWCDKGCSFCYKSSTNRGKHMSLNDYKLIINQAAEIGTFQVALGGGNPNQHPDFIEILEYTKLKGIVPNYTSNGRGLSDEIIEATKRCCGAVAISAYPPYDETEQSLQKLLSAGVKVNLHFILDAYSIDTAISWLKEPPEFLIGINAVIFLNYKPSGRKIFEDKLLRNSDRLDEFFRLATSSKRKLKVGFDACCVSGVFARTNASPVMVDACDAARFSLYVSEDLKVYPCSFQSGLESGDTLNEDTSLVDIWTKSANMQSFRDYFSSDRCGKSCSHMSTCKNGCPIFEQLVVCGHR
ncbi:TPA: radical SAM/SPASM domain-containing protein [Proteus mirabilis]|uniref:radical SAM/SPASM domain-containing protein n=1 Tax=Proteus mirabilis TaxID=584 RepID=UPI0018C74C74|nr:radical SAM protein [Proteus mirabilis]MBG2786336.1 radical SAM protein [Proteus mirabilis]MBI6438665.1 radical SAM protein [Proteus mirabilis]MCZ4601834.1 radical SAM protein [Proteus mirabilis]MDF7256972.1 radical SAM protein [Proteus mirabilis]MDF7350707.1 radical SAM protein [Proteus mirabilis]